MSRRLRAYERAQEAAREQPAGEPEHLDLRGLARKLLVPEEFYEEGGDLNPTQERFIFSADRVKWYSGPLGCAKTSSLVGSAVIPCLIMPGSEWLIARWIYWTLEETTMKRFDECVRRLGAGIIVDEDAGPPRKVWIAPAVPGPPSCITFSGLDDPGKWGSTEYDGIAIDEANEIPQETAITLKGRLRHRRPGQRRPEGPYFLNMASNPPERAHWLHQNFCMEDDCEVDHAMGTKFHATKEENEENLPDRYYEQAAIGMTPAQRIRFIDGECGPDPHGVGIFSEEFHQQIHVADLQVIPNLPMGRSWDFGRRRPGTVWFQVTPKGQINRYYAKLGKDQSTESYCTEVLALSEMMFPQVKRWFDVCDPHGAARKSVGDKTDIEILQTHGVMPRWRDVGVKTGLELMSKGLNTMRAGRPISMYDRRGCQLLISAYGGGYQWPVTRVGQPVREKPLADGYYEHVMDCERYIMVNLTLGSTVDYDKHRKVLRKISSPLTGY